MEPFGVWGQGSKCQGLLEAQKRALGPGQNLGEGWWRRGQRMRAGLPTALRAMGTHAQRRGEI